MGCDIHLFLEKRLSKNEVWQLDENHTIKIEDDEEYLNEVDATGRDYSLFSVLAGVRRMADYPCIYERRGLPYDVSELLKVPQQDGHSHSWLTLDEFKNCLIAAGYDLTTNKSCEAFYEYSSYPGGWNALPEHYTTVVNYCEQWIANEAAEAMLLNRTDIEPEVRLIFWFDS